MLYSRCRCYLLSFSPTRGRVRQRLVGVGDLRVFPQVFQAGLTEADHFEVHEENTGEGEVCRISRKRVSRYETDSTTTLVG